MSAPKPKEPAAKPPQRWRENLEALTMAIVVALLFKYFVLEISKIPSGSMQPTLMGNPETGVFDRTVVDKLTYRLRDPKRFEIVVFKHPLERSRIMVKRLVGMPGEELKIQDGDLWTRANDAEPWRHLRRPPAVQRAMWRRLRRDPRTPDWSVVRGGKEWSVSEDGVRARGDGAARFRPSAGPIRDGYRDGYPRALIDEVRRPPHVEETHAVGDLRLTGELTVLAGTSAVRFELSEGQRTYEFTLPGPDAPSDSAVTCRIRDSATGSERIETGERQRLSAGVALELALENIDDRLALELDGRTLFAAEIEPSSRQESALTLAVEGEGADFARLAVARDVYYLTRDGRSSWSVVIPPGHYVMLGDNTQDSADSRLWDAQTYAFVPDDGGPALTGVRGNFRQGENPVFGTLEGEPGVRFRDQWGEVRWFARRSVPPDHPTLPGNAPLVPRELVLGRAWAVFWPIRPFDGLWRLGWLR
jgi:signal peptidase I